MSELAARGSEAGLDETLTAEDWFRGTRGFFGTKMVGPWPPSVAAVQGVLETSFNPLWKPPAWLESTVDQLEQLLNLPRDWNSYRAERVRPELARALVDLLSEIMSDDTPAPTLVPTASGGVQAEWHRKGYDLEVEVLSAYRFGVYFEDLKTGKGESLEVTSDLRAIVGWIAAVSG